MNKGDRTKPNESHYWTLRQLDASNVHSWNPTRTDPLPEVKVFFNNNFLHHQFCQEGDEQRIQAQLLALACWDQPAPPQEALLARLCLRCYVSHQIVSGCYTALRAARSLDTEQHRQLKQELLCCCLRCALTDDGRLDLGTYAPLSIQILTSFDPTRGSLKSWALLKVRQSPEVGTCFLQFGIIPRSDWAILNKARPSPWMSDFERQILAVYHQVYRRDRLQNRPHSGKTCPSPTLNQCREMQLLLREQGTTIDSEKLLEQLKSLAQTCRQYSAYSSYGSLIVSESLDQNWQRDDNERALEIPDPSIPIDLIDQLEEKEQQTLQQDLAPLCQVELETCLDRGIRQVVENRIAALGRSRRQADCAAQVIPALKLLYGKGMSNRQIAEALGFSNGSKVSRVLEPERMAKTIRQAVIEQLLTGLVPKILGRLTERQSLLSPLSEHDRLVESITEYVDALVFDRAIAEISAGKNRKMDSLYAQRLRRFLDTV